MKLPTTAVIAVADAPAASAARDHNAAAPAARDPKVVVAWVARALAAVRVRAAQAAQVVRAVPAVIVAVEANAVVSVARAAMIVAVRVATNVPRRSRCPK